MRCFIIGNGKSREGFDLTKLSTHGKVFGCNALYRDFKPEYNLPDYLIAIDDKMIAEIVESDFPKDRFIEPREVEKFEDPRWNRFTQFRSNAGMNAMMEAHKMGFREMFCLGMDFIIDGDLTTSNMYAGTNAYGPETATSHGDSKRRCQYFNWFCRNYYDAKFRMVLPDTKEGQTIRINPVSAPNCTGMFYAQLEEMIASAFV